MFASKVPEMTTEGFNAACPSHMSRFSSDHQLSIIQKVLKLTTLSHTRGFHTADPCHRMLPSTPLSTPPAPMPISTPSCCPRKVRCPHSVSCDLLQCSLTAGTQSNTYMLIPCSWLAMPSTGPGPHLTD